MSQTNRCNTVRISPWRACNNRHGNLENKLISLLLSSLWLTPLFCHMLRWRQCVGISMCFSSFGLRDSLGRSQGESAGDTFTH